jgi:hypothetical protein
MKCNYFNISNFSQKKYQFFKLYKYFLLDDSFREISSEAKIAYSIFENRHQSSALKPEFTDEDGRNFIMFSRTELTSALNCGTHKAADIMKELTDFGLIERSKKIGTFDSKKNNGQYRTYVHDYTDFIKSKKSKMNDGRFDPMLSRDFYMIPYDLFDSRKEFFCLPVNVKITYSVLLNLCVLSYENKAYWDEDGNLFVRLTVAELCNIFGGEKYCSTRTAKRYFDQLVACGLVERRKVGNDNRIYVKNFLSVEGDKTDTIEGDKTDTIEGDKTDTIEGDKTDTIALLILTRINKLELYKLDLDNISHSDKLNLDNNHTHDLNYLSCLVRKKFGIDDLIEFYKLPFHRFPEQIKAIIEIIETVSDVLVSVFTSKRTYHICSTQISSEDFVDMLLTLESEDIDWIVSKIYDSSAQIINLHGYILAALYNAATEVKPHELQA